MVLTFEFKANLTPEQQVLVDEWLKSLRIAWNLGLSALEELETFKGYADKKGHFKAFLEDIEGHTLPCCPINWELRPYYLNKDDTINQSDKGTLIFAPYCSILSDRSRWYVKQLPRTKIETGAEQKDSWGWQSDKFGCSGYSCSLPQDYKKPLLNSISMTSSTGPGAVISTKNIDAQRYPELLKVPQRFRVGTITSLAVSWTEYIKSKSPNAKIKRGKPRYKRGGQDELTTLINPNPDKKGMIPIGDDQLKGIPGLGIIKIKGLDRRWKNPDETIPEIATFKICRRPSGYYVQLTGEIQRSLKVKPRDKVTAFDPGLHTLITFADGTKVKPPKFFRKAEKRLERLQQKLARKLTHRLILWLNHPQRTTADIRQFCPSVSIDKAKQVMSAKTEKDIVELIGSSALNTLKYRAFQDVPEKERFTRTPSQREARLKLLISRTHERIRLQRRNFLHKLSTFTVRNHGTIIAEDGLQSPNLRKRAEAKLREDGTGYERNNAKAKSGLSKSLADASPGAFISQVKTKSKAAGRNFFPYPAAYTTQECPVCDHRQTMPPDVRWYKCQQCGWECDRDQKSGILMIVKMLESGAIQEVGLPEVVLETRCARVAWQEAHPPENSSRGSCKNQRTEKKPRNSRKLKTSDDP